jgi:hypothetical protein
MKPFETLLQKYFMPGNVLIDSYDRSWSRTQKYFLKKNRDG